MKRNYIFAMGLTLAMMLGVLAGCGNGATGSSTPATSVPAGSAEASNVESGAKPEFIFKLSHDGPSVGIQPDGHRYFKKIVEERSNGRIQVDLYHGASLADKASSLEGLQLGTIEMAECSAIDFSSYSNIWDVLGLPYFFESSSQAVQTFRAPSVHALFEANAEENGFMILSWVDVGSRDVFTSKKPINSVNDMNGLKIRVMSSPALVACMTDFGANPISLPWNDCYAALQQGTVDAVENSNAVILSNGIPELGGYYAYTRHFTVPDVIVFSKAVYDSLPADLQEIVLQAGIDLEHHWNEMLWPEAEKTSTEEIAAADVEFTNPDLTGFTAASEKTKATLTEAYSAGQKEAYDLINSVKDNYK